MHDVMLCTTVCCCDNNPFKSTCCWVRLPTRSSRVAELLSRMRMTPKRQSRESLSFAGRCGVRV
jgi:hypothetical protein